MPQRYEGDIVFDNDSSLFFEKADGTLKEFVRIDSSDNIKLINVTSAALSWLPTTTNTYDIGSSSLKWKDIYVAGNGLIDGTLGVTGLSTLGTATVTGLSTLGAITAVGTTSVNVTGTAATSIGNATGKTAITGDITTTTGNVIIATLGKGLQVKEGSNAKMGQSTLSSGTVTVSTTAVTASSRIILSRAAIGSSTAAGNLCVGTVTAGTSFVINSLIDLTVGVQAGDLSVINWLIVEPS